MDWVGVLEIILQETKGKVASQWQNQYSISTLTNKK